MKIQIDDILVDHGDNVSRDPLTAQDCQDLAASIAQRGQISPVLVTPRDLPDHKYKLVCGYRRLVAMGGVLGAAEVEATIKEGVTDDEARILNAIENLERLDLDYWGWCKALKKAFQPDTTETEISKIVNRSRTWVRCRWLIWKLPEEVIAQVEQGLLTSTDVGLLIQKSPEEQIAAAARLRAGKEAGETTNSMLQQFSRRKTMRPKKEIQETMTALLSQGKHNEMHCLRYAIGEISDTQLYELLK